MKRTALTCGTLALALAACNAIFGLDEVEPLEPEPAAGGGTATQGGGGSDGGGSTDGGGGVAGSGGTGGGGSPVGAGTCDDPILLALPATVSGTTAGAPDDLAAFCAAPGGIEKVYGFTAPETGRVFVSATGMPDLSVQVRSACPDEPMPQTCCVPNVVNGCEKPEVSACVCDFDAYCCAGWDAYCVSEASLYCNAQCTVLGCHNFKNAPDATEQMLAPVKQGETYYVVVDALGGTGQFDIEAWMSAACTIDDDCGSMDRSCQRLPNGERWCLPEGSCNNATILQPTPQQNMGDTAQGSATHSGSCGYVFAGGYQSGKEDVWGFIAPASGMATVALASPVDAMFYVRSECSDADSEIVCAEMKPAGQVEQATFAVQANHGYYVFVDATTDVAGVYSITLTLP